MPKLKFDMQSVKNNGLKEVMFACDKFENFFKHGLRTINFLILHVSTRYAYLLDTSSIRLKKITIDSYLA